MVNGTQLQVGWWSLSLVIALAGPCLAQDSTSVQVSAYAEVYYAYDLARPMDGDRPAFLYNHKRHNEVNANLVLLQAKVSRTKVRGSLGLMAGTYPQYNLAAEPAALRTIFEANVGLRLSAKRDLWLEAGVFPCQLASKLRLVWTASRFREASWRRIHPALKPEHVCFTGRGKVGC